MSKIDLSKAALSSGEIEMVILPEALAELEAAGLSPDDVRAMMMSRSQKMGSPVDDNEMILMRLRGMPAKKADVIDILTDPTYPQKPNTNDNQEEKQGGMAMKKTDWRRWQGWRGWVTWTLGAICYYVYVSLPWPLARRASWMLPRVGDYVEWDNALAAMREEV